MASSTPWVVLLAAGEGLRLRSLTLEPDGSHLPKQFCRFGDAQSLLERTVERALKLAPASRIVAVVADHHARLWPPHLSALPTANVVVQPGNRGTGPGLLLPLMHLLRRDPAACVAVLPADHAFDDEAPFEMAARAALAEARLRDEVLLLGIEPDSAETGLGWIVPGPADGAASSPVARFVEKPSSQLAGQLLIHGALWSSFVMAGKGASFIGLFERTCPELLAAFRRDPAVLDDPAALARLYERLPAADFSRDVLEGCRSRLRVVPVASCGWSDLGTPDRVLSWMSRRRGPAAASRLPARPATPAFAQPA